MADVFEASGLEFEVEQRVFGDDGGPALMVFGEVDGARRQLLRFDCFRKAPHYHHDPDGRNDVHNLTGKSVPESVAFTIAAVRDRLPEMIRTAGYDGLAEGLDEPAVAALAQQIETAMAA
ncbi:MAG: hypothetical protein HYU66_00375 [Armatimonadetes bacterium]|nr:hypothetical protein [Armatimonadota bacterium]